VKFTCSDALDAAVEGKFDLVFVKDVLEHVYEDGEFVRRLAASLTPHGLIFFSTQNALSLNYAIEGFYQRYLRGNKDWMGWDPTHVRFYTYSKLKKLLQAQGLEPLKWMGTYHLPYRMFKVCGQHVLSTIETTIGRWLHTPELIAGDRFPVNILGWNIAVLAKRAQP
jgi:2-polyprenyl-6-hydroxyphenyl methylase / 3-demethylubiquinone-9 3-methyltransferase